MGKSFQTNGYLIEVTDHKGYTYLLSSQPIAKAIDAWNEMLFLRKHKLYKTIRVKPLAKMLTIEGRIVA